ncbi:MAG TPA: hypothetical protein VJS42_04225 [Steroidobacteraceae bacterium]|nr:hypothetical protein [Steroidobacteraceae bacterium]
MTHQLVVDYPVAPDLAIPEKLQTLFLYLTIVAAAAIVVVALRMAVQRRSAVPVLMAIGGFAAILMEPVVTFLGHAVHPKTGQIVMFEMVSRAIPWHIGLGYMAGFGAFYLFLYARFLDGTLTTATVWKATLITAGCYFIGEAYPVQQGLWVYYEYQPLWLWKGTAPVTWNILNSTSMLASLTLMLVALPYLRGIAQLLLIPLAIAGAYMGHMGAGFPMYNVINSTASPWLMELAGVASVLMALTIVWLCSMVLVRESKQIASVEVNGVRHPGRFNETLASGSRL